MTFKAYMENIKAKSGMTPDDFYKAAGKKGFIKRGKITATHAQLLKWLKSGIGLGHVHANMIIFYLRFRTDDPKAGSKMKNWAIKSWDKKVEAEINKKDLKARKSK